MRTADMVLNHPRGCFIDPRTVAHPISDLVAGALDVLIESLGKSELPAKPRVGDRRRGEIALHRQDFGKREVALD